MTRTNSIHRLGIILLLLQTVSGAVQGEQRTSERDRVPVSVAEAGMAPVIDEVPLSGTVTAPRSAGLSIAVGGLVETVHVEAGDRVEAGTLLVSIDPELARHELARRQAASQQAQVEKAEAERRLDEAEALINRRSIAESEVENRRAAVDAANARLAQRQAEQALQRAQLDRHQVKAPFAGAINRKLTNAGEWVEPGRVLVELVNLENLRIDFAAPQDVFARLTLETPIQLQLAGQSAAIAGRILRIVPVTDPQARSFVIHAQPTKATAMTPGMSARGTLHLSGPEQAVVIPRDALLRDPSGRTTVWTLDRSAEAPAARERKVTVEAAFGDRVALASGLEAGEEVIVRGNSRLQEGQRVRVTP